MMIGKEDASSGTRCSESGVEQFLSAEAYRRDAHQGVWSLGSGEPSHQWLVDSGATCHIVSERHVHHYQVSHVYPGPPPVLRGANNGLIPTRRMVDLKFKIGRVQVTMTKVVVADIILNVLSTYALMESGWRTVLSSPTDSRLEFKKHTFSLSVADRSWWLSVSPDLAKTKKNQKEKTDKPIPMDLSAVTEKNATVPEELPAKVEDSELTKVSSPSQVVVKVSDPKQSKFPKKDLKPSKSSTYRRKGSQTREEVVGSFSYVCRMFSYVDPATLTEHVLTNEPNTNLTSQDLEDSGDWQSDSSSSLESQELRCSTVLWISTKC